MAEGRGEYFPFRALTSHSNHRSKSLRAYKAYFLLLEGQTPASWHAHLLLGGWHLGSSACGLKGTLLWLKSQKILQRRNKKLSHSFAPSYTHKYTHAPTLDPASTLWLRCSTQGVTFSRGECGAYTMTWELLIMGHLKPRTFHPSVKVFLNQSAYWTSNWMAI